MKLILPRKVNHSKISNTVFIFLILLCEKPRKVNHCKISNTLFTTWNVNHLEWLSFRGQIMKWISPRKLNHSNTVFIFLILLCEKPRKVNHCKISNTDLQLGR